MRRVLPWVLLVALVFFFRTNPMGMIFPMWLAAYWCRDGLKRWWNRVPMPAAFILSGLTFGLLTEGFAILENWNTAPDRRILLHPDPVCDLLMGICYYALFVVTWYLMLRKIDFSLREVFIVSGLFGIGAEQSGAILRGIVARPVLGSLLAFVVACVYGVFPMLAYLLTKERFPARRRPRIWHYPLALFFLFIFLAVYGNVLHQPLLRLFSRPAAAARTFLSPPSLPNGSFHSPLILRATTTSSADSFNRI
jgi:hypothetical protein